MGSGDWKDALARLRDSAALPPGEDIQHPEPAVEKTKHPALHVTVERKGRRGKVATLIEGFDDDDDAARVAAVLKRSLGVGGSSRGGEVLVQGDCSARVSEILKTEGYKIK